MENLKKESNLEETQEKQEKKAKRSWKPSRKFLMILGLSCIVLLAVIYCGYRLMLAIRPTTSCIDPLKPGEIRPTGCYAEWLIKDVKVSPIILCLKIKIDQCGDTLIVINKCKEPVKIGELSLYPNPTTVHYLGLMRDSSGRVIANKEEYKDYIPEKDDFLEIAGQVGNKTFTISYTKTSALCD